MTKQDAINLLTQKDQLQLLSFYDTLTPQQQENLLAQIEGIDWSLLDVLKTHETVYILMSIPFYNYLSKNFTSKF